MQKWRNLLLSSYLQQLRWTWRRCLRRYSTPAVFWLWLNAQEVQALYRYTGNGRVLDRWEEPTAGAETDPTDATVDADGQMHERTIHTCIHTFRLRTWATDLFVFPPPPLLSPVWGTCSRLHTHCTISVGEMDIHIKAWRKRGAASITEPKTEVQNERWESSKFEPTMAFNSSIYLLS